MSDTSLQKNDLISRLRAGCEYRVSADHTFHGTCKSTRCQAADEIERLWDGILKAIRPVPTIYSVAVTDRLVKHASKYEDERFRYNDRHAGQVLCDAHALGIVASAGDLRKLIGE